MDTIALVMDQIESSRKSELEKGQCIYKVPEEISMPKSLFKPCLVSLGPIHHGLPELRPMEEHKKRYAGKFILRCQRFAYLFIQCVREIEIDLRGLYCEENLRKFERDGYNFVEMMFTDGAFLIEFLLRLHFQQWEEIDRMSQKRWTLLKFDILLLENQLPMFLLKKLFETSCLTDNDSSLSIQKLIETFLVQSDLLWINDEIGVLPHEVMSKTPNFHILGILPNCMALHSKVCYARDETTTVLTLPSSPTISKLYRAGVKFKKSYRKYVEISFIRGVLHIPTLIIDENTERLLANLLAYEMCTGDIHHVSDYVAMMDFLIDSPEDIKILVKHGIIRSSLKDDEAASNLINYLGRNVAIYDSFTYSFLVEKLNKYCESSWAKWQEEVFEWKMDLKQNYVGNPWKLLSVIAAVVLLVLTVIQTVCSILQLK